MSALHKLLLGRWCSDKRKTLAMSLKYCLEPKKRRKLGRLFGELELVYTRSHVYFRLGEFKYRERYDVVAEDEESLVIRGHSKGLTRLMVKQCGEEWRKLFHPKLRQLTFRRIRGSDYYLAGCGRYFEWFKKQPG